MKRLGERLEALQATHKELDTCHCTRIHYVPMRVLHIRNIQQATHNYVPVHVLCVKNWVNYSSVSATHKELSKSYLRHHPSSSGHTDERTDRKSPSDCNNPLPIYFAVKVNKYEITAYYYRPATAIEGYCVS